MDKHGNPKNGEVDNFRRMILNQIAGDEENVPCNTPRNSVHSSFGGSSGRAVASTSSSLNTDSVSPGPGEYLRDPGSILSLQPWIFKRSSSKSNNERMHASGSRAFGTGKNLVDCFRDAHAVEVSARSPGHVSGPGRVCGALRSRSCGDSMKPLVLMDNSCVPHLYSENFEIEECTFAPVPSPASARPFVVTDGRRIISKSRYEPVPVPFNIGFDKEEFRDTSMIPGSMIGIAPLPGLKKFKQEGRESRTARPGVSGSQRSSKSYGQSGLRDRLLLFSTGVSIGILASSLSNKKEFDMLKGTVKRMENLVQDLQDELEMKEGLTVKELPNETSGKQYDDNNKIHVDPEPMSKIEAELEAELARLELNITSKRLEEETSDFNEVDQEFIGDIVCGELKVDMVPRDLTYYSSESDHGRDSRESSPDYTRGTNCPVSPRDLSIRLHKVIQHRLEDRIKELESALAHRQKQASLQMMVADRIFDERICSNSESGSSSNQESPMFIQETSSTAEPYCLNLSGDALEAYDEAYEEFMRIADSPCTTSTNGKPQVTEDYLVDRGLIWGLEEDSSRKPKEVPTWEQVLKSVDPSRAQESDGDAEDETDDDSKMLIQQIVERTKQGSPVLINAQKLLFSVDQ
ncbi:hypothetical protein PAHAL_3G472600 [Panicum hallii]|uniref:Uncharacterized protein n=1 Tax=Panicum hallii TaxID=206008 RepID=A0A2S3HET1_9POAL|nr:uncharacterized protein LOC112884726 [Panicum hallii]PAN21521.1 hypothetical protein PAHAL_3G472600 [Panicum hallii]